MSIRQRVLTCRIIERMEKDKELSEKIGLVNKSKYNQSESLKDGMGRRYE